MKLCGAFCLAFLCAAGLGAQSDTRVYRNKTDQHNAEVKKTVEVKGGETVTAIGCLVANPGGGGYMLTKVGKKKDMQYALVTSNDMSKFLDHRVRIMGRSADSEGGLVKLESTTKLENREVVGTSGQKQTETTIKSRTEDKNKRFLGVKSVASIAKRCS